MPAIPVPAVRSRINTCADTPGSRFGIGKAARMEPSTVGPSTAPRWSPSSLFCGFCYCYYLCYGPSPITWTTPRHGAAQPGYWDVLQALLQEPTDVNTAPLSAVRVPCPIMPSYLIYQMSSKIKLLMISRQFASFFLKALAQVTHP